MSADKKLIIVTYKPGQRLRRRLLFLFSCTLIGAGSFWAGQARETGLAGQGWEQMQQGLQIQESLAQELTDLRSENESLRQQIAILDRGRAVDEVAQRGTLETIQALESTVRQLREDVTFYKNIMSPAADSKGLTIQKLELASGSRDNKFTYKLVLAQMSDNKRDIEGVLAVSILGERNGTDEVLALRDVSPDLKGLGIKFRFRYFQEFTGEMLLPEDFKPEKVQVVVQSSGKNASTLEQLFEWKL